MDPGGAGRTHGRERDMSQREPRLEVKVEPDVFEGLSGREEALTASHGRWLSVSGLLRSSMRYGDGAMGAGTQGPSSGSKPQSVWGLLGGRRDRWLIEDFDGKCMAVW